MLNPTSLSVFTNDSLQLTLDLRDENNLPYPLREKEITKFDLLAGGVRYSGKLVSDNQISFFIPSGILDVKGTIPFAIVIGNENDRIQITVAYGQIFIYDVLPSK